ncbi:hypothetical protein BFP76_08120 [Amylibacter kogurei]|uniref:Cobalamin biosynthesis protein CobQ n=1 Tax=Paramylibacter kogurei TaxID=1889778 RepID=A0A2G5K1U0_9RHOB|nr:cobalamin biosynthesis protein CobQ [Amylibacter kogurei]PIB23498.1 hypothetical protein BFP76_08120 [Amylibacter kogurei]
MNTPAHLILAAAVFARPDKPKVTLGAIAGGFLPDFSLYALVAWSRFIDQNSFSHIFREQYFSQQWQSIFAVDNSFFVWALIIAIGIYLKKHWLWALGGGGFLHLCFDFPLHHDDARQHFWPLTDWVFHSPFSYWDKDHFGGTIEMLEYGLCVVLLVILWRRFKSIFSRSVIAIVATIQILPTILFSWIL